uniref:DUF4371 domain-containing protein n=1 Tax=Amphimedon queenslandica TaxID=400682 RepID=A0A1X7VIT1_AMPQE
MEGSHGKESHHWFFPSTSTSTLSTSKRKAQDQDEHSDSDKDECSDGDQEFFDPDEDYDSESDRQVEMENDNYDDENQESDSTQTCSSECCDDGLGQPYHPSSSALSRKCQDKTQDVSTCEQFAISIRWVDSCHSIHEDLIGMVEVEQTDALPLSSTIIDVLTRCGLSFSNCRGQAYDGSSNMSGHLSGVATRLMAEEPCALYVHCSAHCLNLALQDSSRQSTSVRDALSLAADIANFIRASPKRFAQFRSLKDQLCKANPGIKPLCPTRWTIRTVSIDAILKNYGVIIQQLEET